MKLFAPKQKNLKLVFRLIIAGCFLFFSFNVKAQKLLFKDCLPEENIDSLSKLLIFNQSSTEVDRLRTLIKLDRSYLFRIAIFEKLDEIKTLSDKLNNNTGLCYYYFMKAFFLPHTSVNDAIENLRLGHLYLDKSDDLALKQFCYGIELLCYFNIERTTANGKLPKAKSIFYDKIFLNDNQYNLLNEHQKVDYLILASSFELEVYGGATSNYKKYIDEMNYIIKKFPKTRYAKFSFSLFIVLYYDINRNYDKAILKCKESIEGFDSPDVLFKSRMYYTLANIYIKTNEMQLALTNYRNALFYFNSIEKYDYSPLAAQFEIVSFQIAISSFFKARYKLTTNSLITNSKPKDYLNSMQLDINSMLGLLLSQIEKEKNVILIKRNKDLQVQKVQQELLYKSAELAKYKAELQRLMALKEVVKQKDENVKLYYRNYQKIYIIIGTFILILLLSYFLFRLRKLNKFIKDEQINKDRFFALFSHDLRGIIVNLKDSGEVLNFLIKNQRLDEIQEISRQLDLDGSNALLLLNNMLDWGTLTGYAYQPSFRNLSLTNKVWDIISLYQSGIESKGIKLSITIENGLDLYADEKSIDIVLRNIIANANANTPKGGIISISLEKQQLNQIVFVVSNSVIELKRGGLAHIQNIFAGDKKAMVGHHGLGLGVVLMTEYAKKSGLNLALSFENNIVTFKAFF